MLCRRLIPLALLVPTLLTAQESGWNIDDVHGPADTVHFQTDEGTWMNVDVSPDGRWIVFDLLGDIYRLAMAGGQAQHLTSGRAFDQQPRFSPDGRTIVFVSDRSGKNNLWLMNADGANPRQLTALNDSLATTPAWMPDGTSIVATRHVRGAGALGGEVWLFDVQGGTGARLANTTDLKSAQWEPFPSTDGRWIYITRPGSAGTDANSDGGTFQIARINRETGAEETVTTVPGDAIRPTVSPDGTTLAFLERAGAKTTLVLRDLATGTERLGFDGLDSGNGDPSAYGAYPAYAWMPDSKALTLAIGGKLHHLDVATNDTTLIPFTAPVEQVVERALHFNHRIAAAFSVHDVRRPVLSPDGGTLVFEAVGALWEMSDTGGTPVRVNPPPEPRRPRMRSGFRGPERREGPAAPVIAVPGEPFELSPTFTPDGRAIVYATWSDSTAGHVWSAETGKKNKPHRLTKTPNRYLNPEVSPDGKWIAVIEGAGAQTDSAADLANPPFWAVAVLPIDGGQPREVTRIENGGAAGRMPHAWWSADGTRLLVRDSHDGRTRLSSVALDSVDRRTVVQNAQVDEIVPSPDGKWIAFTQARNVFVAPLPDSSGPTGALDASTAGAMLVSRNGGAWLAWRPDSRALTWSIGSTFYVQSLADAEEPLGIAASAGTVEDPSRTIDIRLRVPRSRPTGAIVLRGARVITMKGNEVIEHADVLVEGSRIVRVCRSPCSGIPLMTRTVPLPGKTIIPGFVDVHADLARMTLAVLPQNMWQYWANLAFGVTTTFDPSSSESGVALSELVDAGRMTGPRVYSTRRTPPGEDHLTTIASLDDARTYVQRLKTTGAGAVVSPPALQRAGRQWIVQAAREAQMLVVPDGGSTLQQDVTMILDGYSGIEQSLPVTPLHQDVLTLLGHSKTAYTATLVVGPGGIWGDDYWHGQSDVFGNDRLSKFMPAAELNAPARSRSLAAEAKASHIALSRTAHGAHDAGATVQLGAYGRLQGLGVHWALWMLAQGGMSPHDALYAATRAGADYLGLGADIGSLEPGKLADLVVLDANPLEDVHNTEQIFMVMKNGELFDADMQKLWPDSLGGPEGRRTGGRERR